MNIDCEEAKHSFVGILRKWVVILLFFSLITSPCAYSQSTIEIEIQNLHNCNNQLFQKIQTAIKDVTNQDIEISQDLVLAYLLSRSKPATSNFAKYGMYAIASFVYVALEETSKSVSIKYKNILDQKMDLLNKEINYTKKIKKLEKLNQKLVDLKSTLNGMKQIPASSKTAIILEQTGKLEEKILSTQGKYNEIEKLLAEYKNTSTRIRTKLVGLFTATVIIQAVLLWGYIVSLDEIGHHSKEADANNFPTTYQTLQQAKTVNDYESQLMSTNPEVSKLRRELYQSCRDALKEDMDLWVKSLLQASSKDIRFALDGIHSSLENP